MLALQQTLSFNLKQPAQWKRSQWCCMMKGPSLRIEQSTHRWRRSAVEIDLTNPDTLLAVGAAAVGLAVGVGYPIFMISRDDLDEKKVETIRELNKQTYEATGEYLSKDELSKIRTPRWTDRREYQDDD